MRHLCSARVLYTLWLPLFLLGCERAQEGTEGDLPPEPQPAAVLNPDDDAKTIVRKGIKAYGDEESFARWSCGTMMYKTQGGIVPAEFGEVIVVDTFQFPGHFKREAFTATVGKESLMVFVLNDGKGWSKVGDGPAEPIESHSTDNAQHPFAGFCNLSPLTEPDACLTKLGAEKVNGKNVIGIRAQSEKLGEVELYFGVQSGLLLRSRKMLPRADSGNPSVAETLLDDYRIVQGTPVPMRIKGWLNGHPLVDVTLIDVRFADKYEASTFAKP